MLYKNLIRPVLMNMDPERAHEMAVRALINPLSAPFFGLNRLLHRVKSPILQTTLCGIPLENPVGLAAGFDKNAVMYAKLHKLGFGFVEIGTVTAHEQPGNEKPRLFRLLEDRALINRMGFNNDGADSVTARLRKNRAQIPLGGNIGKSKITPLEKAVEDYAYSFRLMADHINYFVVNVSSPNTPNLRKLQAREPLLELLLHLVSLNQHHQLPILLKIAPDLNDHELEDIVSVVQDSGVSGVIATNTTITRDGLTAGSEQISAIGAGGLSGPPVKQRSTEVIRFLRRHLSKNIDIVGVGGIADGHDAYEKIKAGACCVQIYTGLVYGGPNTVFNILSQLEKLLQKDGYQQLSDAVGVEAGS